MYIFIGILIIIVLYIFITFNSLVKLKQRVVEAFSTMDVYLKKRWDLIPNLVETVKGYDFHEKDTLINVVNARNSSYDSLSTKEKINSDKEITNILNKLMMLVEQYPELKANDNYKKLSDELINVEDEIAKSRKYYNATVRMLNNKVEMIPSNIVALIFNIKKESMFEANDDERENFKVDLNK